MEMNIRKKHGLNELWIEESEQNKPTKNKRKSKTQTNQSHSHAFCFHVYVVPVKTLMVMVLMLAITLASSSNCIHPHIRITCGLELSRQLDFGITISDLTSALQMSWACCGCSDWYCGG